MSQRGTSDRPRLVLYDDRAARDFEPFALTRPIATLTSGTIGAWNRWAASLGASAAGVIAGPHLDDFDEAPGCVRGVLPRGTWVANSRFAPRSVATADDDTALGRGVEGPATDSLWCDGRVAAVRLDREVPIAELADGTRPLDALVPMDGRAARGDVLGWWHDEVWDYVRHLGSVLASDIDSMGSRWANLRTEGPSVPDHTVVLGTHRIMIHGHALGPESQPPAVIEPHVVLDVTAGPIYVGHSARIRAFSRLNGPCYVGPHTIVAGGEISNSSIGPHCKVRGEISSSVFLGYSNKGHDGFLGHSYVGRWVNLGAGTTTSNLKNTYGSVALWTPDGIRDTGMQFLGTLFGDHAKTGIGTMLTTGTVLGAGANVYGAGMPPKVVPPFSWGDGEPYDVYRLDKFLESAQRMMERRLVPLTDRMRRQLGESHRLRWTPGAR